jgi:hypothetical protein
MKKDKPTVEETGREGDLATFRALVGGIEVAKIVVHVPTGVVREMNSTGPRFELSHMSKFGSSSEKAPGLPG